MFAVLILAILLPMLMAAAILLRRHLQRRQELLRLELSPVSRQHLDLFQGGQLNESAIESAKARFLTLLERGEVERIEASLRPGTLYVVQVRALAELGTEDAGRILERQLQRRLTDDQVEQSWYWIDLANGLRSLNRSQSLPHLLRCAEMAGEIPLGHFFAAETVCFLGFAGYIRQAETPLGRAALRVLHKTLEGLRCGVQGQVVAEGRLGEVIETLWDNRPQPPDPLVIRVFAETRRLHRRAGHVAATLAGEAAEVEALQWQMSRLAALEPLLIEYLEDSPRHLRKLLLDAVTPERQRDILMALADLRAEAGPAVMQMLSGPVHPHADLAVEVLRWSRDERVGAWLRDWVARRLPLDRRISKRRQPEPPSRSSVPADLPYAAILRALRGHPSAEMESFLVLASQDWDPTYRAAALGSLGWWDPYQQNETLLCLQTGKRDPNVEVRQAARAALARLGQRPALQWFRQTLTSEDVQRVHEGIQAVAVEGLTLLWPDLDRLADAEDPDIASHAREALERLCEDMECLR